MRSKTELLQDVYGVRTSDEAQAIEISDRLSYRRLDPSSITKFSLPYEAPDHPDLPSMDDIERGMRDNKLIGEWGHDICRVGECVVKRSRDPAVLQEAEDMLFLQANSKVRTPKVYAVFDRDIVLEGQTYQTHHIVMEFIKGEALSAEKWLNFDEATRRKIRSRFCEQLSLLRAIPSEGYYGRVYNQSFLPETSPFYVRGKEMSGPYNTSEEFIAAVATATQLSAAIGRSPADYYPEEEHLLSRVERTLATFKGWRPTFTHMRLELPNIIVRPLGGEGQHAEDWEVTLIDWAASGWMPAWMQAVAFRQFLNMSTASGGGDTEVRDQFLEQVYQSFEEPYSEQIDFFNELFELACYGV